MNEIVRIEDPISIMMNDVFKFNNAFFNNPINSITTNGFKKRISKPHNLIEVKDDKGNTISQRIEIVTTPFAKDDVRVTIKDDTLNVICGTEKAEENKNEEYIYRGISAQTYSFTLRIPENIDQNKISASNKDGILSITLPIKEIEKEEEKEIEIKVD